MLKFSQIVPNMLKDLSPSQYNAEQLYAMLTYHLMMPTRSNSTVDVGIEDPQNKSRTAKNVDPDIWAYARSRDIGTEWAVERTDETIVMVETFRLKGERVERDGEPIAFDVEQGQSTEDWVHHYANRNPEGKVEEARQYFEG
jgi:hypothetical protein